VSEASEPPNNPLVNTPIGADIRLTPAAAKNGLARVERVLGVA
jgi:hypothetical protein